ncbi:MAG: spermidine synthase [Actinomycetota bacterium]
MNDRRRLVLASFLMLFTELVLIRWSGASVVYLSYFSNFVLLGSFLGIGVGFLRARSSTDLFRWAPVAMAFFVTFVVKFPVVLDRSGSTLVFFGSLAQRGAPMWVMLPIVFCAVAVIMACVAQGVARLFSRFEPLDAYRLDILGSILGIAAFSLLAFLGTPPSVWAAVLAVSFLLVMGRLALLQTISLLAVIALFALVSPTATIETWSPYYKIDASAMTIEGQPVYGISVNSIPHQSIIGAALRLKLEPTYGLPYERASGAPLRNILIVGAGTGSDVSIALRAGAQHVDAVEIDPKLQVLGSQLHPDRPYQDPRVTAIVNDGRAFLERTDQKYDLILFALPDSLTLVSGQSALRLESYLFTEEAIGSAAAHLTPRGSFGMYNYYREVWLVDRLAGTLQTVFGTTPCIDVDPFDAGPSIGNFSLLMDSKDPTALACAQTWDPDERSVPAPATDDHPFVYLRTWTIPSLYLIVLAMVLIASLVLIRVAGGPLRAMGSHLDLFLMGAAFLLLETKNVVQFALLFGTTWFVNALVFGGILLTVLAAVEVARRVRVRRVGLLWGGLAASLFVAWVVPAHVLLSLEVVPRFLAATTLAFAPVFLANLIFAERFRDVAESTTAFGANLLGAMVGGVVEYLSLLIGYRALLVVAAVIYGLAFACGRGRGSDPTASARPSLSAPGPA